MSELSLPEIHLEANNGRLAVLAAHILRLVDENHEGSLVEVIPYEPNESVAVLTAGSVTAEDVAMSYREQDIHLEEDVAERIAGIENATRKTQALMSVHSVLGATSIFHFEDLKSKGVDEEPRTLTFQRGSLRSAHYVGSQPGVVHSVHVTEVEGLEGGGSARGYELETVDDLIKQRIDLTEVDGRIRDAQLRLTPTDDQLLERCVRVLSEDIPDLLQLLVGRFDDTESLEADFVTIRNKYAGSSLEEEVEPLLAEVRIRAIAAKEAQALDSMHNSLAPVPDKLDETIKELSHIA